MPTTTVAFIDDHPVLHDGISAVFEQKSQYSLVAFGTSAADVSKILAEHHPDIMIVDIGMPGDAFGAIAEASGAASSTKIIVFTASTSVEDALHAFDAGAVGYALKRHAIDQLDDAIEAVVRGDIYITSSMSAAVMQALKEKTARASADYMRDLNQKEEDIVGLLLCGKKNSEIASIMNLSEKTIKNYMTSLMQKFNVKSRLELLISAQNIYQKPPQKN